MENQEHKEGATTKAIENQTAKLPSDAFLFSALASMALSLSLKIMGRPKDAMFVGQWAAPILIMGVYNKLVKQAGNDSTNNSKTK